MKKALLVGGSLLVLGGIAYALTRSSKPSILPGTGFGTNYAYAVPNGTTATLNGLPTQYLSTMGHPLANGTTQYNTGSQIITKDANGNIVSRVNV